MRSQRQLRTIVRFGTFDSEYFPLRYAQRFRGARILLINFPRKRKREAGTSEGRGGGGERGRQPALRYVSARAGIARIPASLSSDNRVKISFAG